MLFSPHSAFPARQNMTHNVKVIVGLLACALSFAPAGFMLSMGWGLTGSRAYQIVDQDEDEEAYQATVKFWLMAGGAVSTLILGFLIYDAWRS